MRTSLLLALSALLLSIGLVPGRVQAQAEDPVFRIDKSRIGPQSRVPGEIVRYRVTYSCSSNTTNCVSLRIEDTLPPQLELVSCDFPFFNLTSAPASPSVCPTGSASFDFTRTPFNAGTTGEGFIVARVRVGTPATTNIINSISGTIGVVPVGGTQTRIDPAEPVDVIAATARPYEIRKVRIDPTPALPISDLATTVTDRVQFCATTAVNAVQLNGATIYDDIAAGTILSTTQPPGVAAATIVGTRATWTIPPAVISLAALYPPGSDPTQASCLDFTITYSLPPGATPVPNRAIVRTPDTQFCSDSLGAPPAPGAGDAGPAVCIASTPGVRGAPAGVDDIRKVGNDATPSDSPNDQGAGRITWRLLGGVQSNVALQNYAVYDSLPSNVIAGLGTPLTVDQLTPGNWATSVPGYTIVADIFTSTTANNTLDCGVAAAGWSLLTGSPFAATNPNNPITAPALPANTGSVCWRFSNIATGPGAAPPNEVPRSFGFTVGPTIRQPVPAAVTPPALPGAITVTNCLFASWQTSSGPANSGAPPQGCREQRVEAPQPSLAPGKSIVSAPPSIRPLDEIVFRITLQHAPGDSTGNIVDPILADVLPPEVEFISATNVAGAPVPANIQTVPNFNGVADSTLVRVLYTPGLSLPPTTASTAMPTVDVRVRVRAGVAQGSFTNSLSAFANNTPPYTCGGAFGVPVLPVADVGDRDGTANNSRCDTSASFSVIEAAVLDGTKWVSGTGPYVDPIDPLVDDPTENPPVANVDCPTYSQSFGAGSGDTFTRFPCVARTQYNGAFNWRIRVQNAGNIAFDNYVLYDVLPFIGDNGVGQPLSGAPRNTRYQPALTGPLVLNTTLSNPAFTAATFEIFYSGSNNACRPEVSSDSNTSGWQGACDDDWAAAPPGGNFANVRAIRIRAFVDLNGTNPTNWGRLQTAVFEAPLVTPTLPTPTAPAPPSVVGSTAVFNPAWGSFAHRAYRAVVSAPLSPDNLLPTAEPLKVGIILPERYRLGNLVWRDVNNNGTSQTGEPGINGVSVRLCRDSDGTSGPTAGDVTVGTTTTGTIGGEAGKYLFEVLERRADYYVAIASVQPALTGLQVSAVNSVGPGNNIDNDNNAQALAVAAACGGGAAFVSTAFDLGTPSNGEPTNETVRNGSGTDDDPNSGAAEPWPDGMSNYSVDFGFSATGGIEDDLGDLPDTNAGTGTGNYQTLLVNNGPSHVRTIGLTIGTVRDTEIDGQPNAAADGDDANPAASDDEEGVVIPAQLRFSRGQPGLLDVRVVNTTATPGRLCGFLDLNADGDFADAGEVAPAINVPAGGAAAGSIVQLNFGTIPAAGLNVDPTYVRLRLSNTDPGACSAAFANGPSASGEVEDYRGAVVAEDRGDLPDGLAGVPSYPTLNASNGAVHVISTANTFLGASVDAEPNGQPTVVANGDDVNPAAQPDDEDGVTFPTPIVAGRASSISVTASVAGRLNCWFDYDNNGTLGGTVGGQPEQFANDFAVSAGANTVPLTPPFAIARANYYLRCRFTTGPGQATAPTGSAPNGEVEDYLVRITQPDLGDLPDTGPGVGAGNYQTLRANGGAEHPIFDLPGATLRLGAAIDAEVDGQQSLGADGDDTNPVAIDDEDGITVADLTMTAATTGLVRFTATNTLAVAATVCGFVDFDGDGDLTDVGELAQAPVAAGSNGVPGTLSFTVPATAVRDTYARFRISTAAGCVPNGLAPDGEVEDYRATIIAFDLGDLPNGVGAGLYPTLRTGNGPRHEIVPGLRLGALIDAEGDGQPNIPATGDDIAAPAADDEDGVTFDPLNLGSPGRANVSLLNSTGTAATLCVFVDWNNDGDFADTFTITTPGGGTTSETITQSVPSAAAVQTRVVQLGTVPPPGTVGVPPAGAVTQPYVRVRLSTTPGFTCTAGDPPAGISPNGEVEDYRAGSTTGTGLMSLGDLVFEDRNNNCVQDGGEPGIPGVPVSVFRDTNNDNVRDGPAVATQNTTGTGSYLFTNLVPDNYLVSIVRPTRYIGSTGSVPYTGSGPCEPAADPDTDTVNSRDKGTGAGATVTEIVSRSVTLDPKNEPDDGTNGYWRVDFGVVPNFDLSLRKELAPGQPTVVLVGQRVNYVITVTNEGTIPATAIAIVDRIPFGMVLDDAAWTAGAGTPPTATRTIAGPLAPATSTTVTIGLRVTNNAVGSFINRAEISSARDDGNGLLPDIDSVPNDGIDGQDDIDDVTVTQTLSIPAGGPAGWLLLALLLMLGGVLYSRRRATL